MANSTEPTDLGSVSRALQDRPTFLSGSLAAISGAEQEVRTSLGLSYQQFHRLLVCRTPRPAYFAADVSAIADYIGIEPIALATTLREVAVVAALSQRTQVGQIEVEANTNSWLAAARDTAADLVPPRQASAAIRELASDTWQASPADVRERRDVQSAVVWATPAMVVIVPRLHMATANQWLTHRGIPPLPGSMGELRGLLVAWRGQAAIFVDGTLAEAERRLTIAHEHGHLLLDYFAPRQRILRNAPDLLDVIDGYRSPTDADRARAALARVPFGAHTHLLARDDYGGAAATTVAAEEDATIYALELLAPFDDVVALVREGLDSHLPYRDRLASAATQVAEVFALPADAAGARAAGALEALGIQPGFFDR